jgi:hypothetical protein
MTQEQIDTITEKFTNKDYSDITIHDLKAYSVYLLSKRKEEAALTLQAQLEQAEDDKKQALINQIAGLLN